MARRRRLRINEDAYDRDLERAVDILYEKVAYEKDWDWKELAKEAHLSYATVLRLGNRITKLPRWQTLWKLATALDMETAFVDRSGNVLIGSQPRLAHAA